MNESTNLSSRMDELETKLMFQQDIMETLNNTVVEQWKVIDQLKSKLGMLNDQLYELETSSTNGHIVEKPPHY